MGRLLVIVAAFVVGWFFWRALRRKLDSFHHAARKRRDANGGKNGKRLVACPRCGVYLPEGEECNCG
jgi:hypothetical protein